MQYLAQWPEYFQVAELPSGEVTGYEMGKAEGHGETWHGHVTALTMSPRRLGFAAILMTWLEDISEKKTSLLRGPVCPCIEPSFNQHVQSSWLHIVPKQ